MKIKIFAKATILLLSIISISISATAQVKIVDRSAKKAPVWYGGAQSEYIITSSEASSLERAKEMVMENVRKQIIQAVALNVKESTASNISQTSNGSDIVNFLDSFTSSSSTQSANLPFLKGVSPSKIEDFYWEKRFNKSTGETSYIYSIKYPLPRLELKKMLAEFDRLDGEMTQKLTSLEQGLNNITSLETIDQAVVAANPLIAYFFDDVRSTRAKTVKANYIKLYDNITIEPISNKLGEYRFSVLFKGTPITFSQRAVLKSNCATAITITSEGTTYIVRYDHESCLENEDNFIDVTIRINNRPVKHLINFDVRKEKLQLTPKGTATIIAKNDKDTISNIRIRYNIESKYTGGFVVKEISIGAPIFIGSILASNLNLEFSGAGNHTIDFVCDDTLAICKNDGKLNFINGYMIVINSETGNSHRIVINMPYTKTW
ncbi:MAG: hypothetical protein RSB93_00745 [Rikenellaceae bacterium]